MKHIIALLFVLFALANADYRLRNQDDLNKTRKECFEAKKVPEGHQEKYRKFDFPDDEITRCYLQCVFEKFELFHPKAGLIKANLIQQLSAGKQDDTIREQVNKCVDNNDQKSDSCTWVYRVFKCFLQNSLSLVQEVVKD